MGDKGRVIIIGLDGVSFDLLYDLSSSGIMPSTANIITQGVFRRMKSSIPDVSSVAWSSIITGEDPGAHGIFGFTDLVPHSYSLRFPNFNDLKSPPFWNDVEGGSVIINVPGTYPVKEMGGVHISGFVSIELERSVFPRSLVSKLKALDYRLDVDSQVAHESLDLFLSDLDKTLEARVQTYRYLWESQDWQVFMLVFTGTDRLMHFLWSAYEDKGHKYHHDFLRHFHEIDEVIGEINARMKEEDTLVILSDHGFEGLDLDVYVNYLLKKEGFLKTKKGEEPTLENIDPLTKAFALDPARIYVNLKDRYPNGGINKDDKEKVLKDLEDLFASFEIEGRSVIKDIYRGEEIYSGPCLDKAPDLILEGNHGFNLKADIKADTLTRKGIFTGKHTRDNAFFLLGAKEDIMYPVDNLHVSDAISIIYKGRVV